MHCLMHCLMHWLDALLDSRSTRFPFTSTPSPPAPLAIRKAPSASVESIEPRPPQTAKSADRKGGEVKTDANLTIFSAPAAPRPIAALHFLPPTGDSDEEAEVSIPNLISLLPLDEVPVHVP